MAENMIKFLRGNVANLPQTATEGALYFTKDEGIYLGLANGAYHRYGDFIIVANTDALPTAGAHETCMYYCTEQNILCRYDSVKGWQQINKQPTVEEMKTLLGLGSLAYLSEVAEDNLSSALKEKVNAAAEGNHSHSNKGVLDGISAEKVAAWDAAEGNAIAHANGLNTTMSARVDALEAIDHDHANKAELDLIATGDKAKWDTAAGKAHEHANAAELAKIVDGDKAKWDAVAADHLTSADKTTLENSIKEAKKAGTDANTNIETYKVSNDARVLAVEEDVAEITDGTNGILAQAKSYSDGKLATARTEISAEIDGDVKVVSDALADYKTANDAALAGVKATADAAAVKTEVETALAGKVDKVEGKDLIATSEIERLLTLHNYDDTKVKEDIAKKADAEAMTTELGKKVDKVEGYSLVSDAEIERLGTLKNYDDTALAGRVTAAEGKITALETESAKHATKDELNAVDAKFASYNTTAAQKVIDDAQDARIKAIEDTYLVEADIANFETKANVKKVADDLAAYVESNDEALAGVRDIAEAARTEDEVNSQIDAKITALNLGTTYEPIGAETRAKAYADGLISDANLGQYTTEQEVKDIVDGVIAGAVDGDTITGLANLVEYINTHGGEAAEMGAAIDVLEGKVETIEGKPAYGITATQISNWDGEVGAKALAETKTTTAEVKAQIEAYGYATTGYADGKASDAQAAAEATAAAALATAVENVKTDASNKDAVVLAEAQAYADQAKADAIASAEGKVSALSGNVYTKEQTYTQAEVDALLSAAQSWGEF